MRARQIFDLKEAEADPRHNAKVLSWDSAARFKAAAIGRRPAVRSADTKLISSLAQIAVSTTSAGQPREVFDALAGSVAGATGSTACIVSIVHVVDQGHFHIRAAGGYGISENMFRSLTTVVAADSRHPIARTIRMAQPLELPQVRRLRDVTSLHETEDSGLITFDQLGAIVLPISCHDQVIGLLHLIEPSWDYTHPDELMFLRAVATQAAVALEHVRLVGEAQDRARLDERKRMARELHDSVAQAFYGIVAGVETARDELDHDPQQVAEVLSYVRTLAQTGLAEMRTLLVALHPGILESAGLISTLQQQLVVLQAHHGLRVEASLGNEPDLPLAAKADLHRIAQEAFNNAIRHARASCLEVRIESTARDLRLKVSDDGSGFEPAETFSGHLGMRSMHERASRLGGTLTVQSAPGQGTSVCVCIPLRA